LSLAKNFPLRTFPNFLFSVLGFSAT